MHFMVQIVLINSNIIKMQVQGYHKIISVKAKEGTRCSMIGVARYQLERAKMLPIMW